MNTCQKCSASIPDGNGFCGKCGAPYQEVIELDGRSDKEKAGTNKTIVWFSMVAVGVLIFAGVQSSRDAPAKPAGYTPPTAAEQPPPKPPLELISYSWRTEYGYAILEGLVKNVSSAPLRQVQAVGLFYDATGGFITSDSTMIDYDPILPGQSSPFKVMSRENPAMKRANIDFKELMGGSIPFTRREKKKKQP